MIDAKLLDPKIIQRHAWNIYSQNGEDGVLAYLISLYDCRKTCVEIGGNLDPLGNPDGHFGIDEVGGLGCGAALRAGAVGPVGARHDVV